VSPLTTNAYADTTHALPSGPSISPQEITSNPVSVWHEINGVSGSGVEGETLVNMADAAGLTTEEMATQLIEEYSESHTDRRLISAEGTSTPLTTNWERMTGTVERMSSVTSQSLPLPTSGGGGSVPQVQLVKARRKTDFLYYPSSTFGYNHGHAAFYARKGRLVEAVNSKVGVRSIKVANRKVPKGETYILSLNEARGSTLLTAMAGFADSWVGSSYRGVLLPIVPSTRHIIARSWCGLYTDFRDGISMITADATYTPSTWRRPPG